MNTKLSRKAVIATTAALIGMISLGTSIDSFAQEAAKTASAPVSKTAALKANYRLEHAVRKMFAKQNQLNSSDVRVVAKNGAVSLEGTMPDDSQIQRAVTLASSTSGVTSVTNSLTVRQEGH
jgi:osmotically-inducible protein OsmY